MPEAQPVPNDAAAQILRSTYLYIPFNEAEGNTQLFGMAKTWQANMAKDARWPNPPPILRHGNGSRLIADLQPDETLFILCHSSNFAEFVAAQPDLHTVLMSANELSRRLIEDGLSTRKRHLILVTCDDRIGNTEEFAQSLFTELRFMGHTCAVYFYFGVSVSLPVIATGSTEAHKYGMNMFGNFSRADRHLWRIDG